MTHTFSFKELKEHYTNMNWHDRLVQGLIFYSDIEDIMWLNSDRVCEEWIATMIDLSMKFNEGDAIALAPTVLAIVHIGYHHPWELNEYYVEHGQVRRHIKVNYHYIWPSDKKRV